MAERRMFTKKITESDAFLDMPASAQALYFHLNMNADDDGFVNSPKSIQRTVGASTDDMKLLLVKKFILAFESGVIVIKHWKMHNYLRSDRYKPTDYVEEKSQLALDEKNAYTMASECLVYQMDTNGIPMVSVGKDRLGEDREGKDRLGKDKHKSAQRSVYYPNDELLDDAFRDFVEHRKKMKAPLTEKAIDLSISKLQKLSGGDSDLAIEIINQSILRGWKGLFAIDTSKKGNAQQGIDWDSV